jgi:hypothetical protein
MTSPPSGSPRGIEDAIGKSGRNAFPAGAVDSACRLAARAVGGSCPHALGRASDCLIFYQRKSDGMARFKGLAPFAASSSMRAPPFDTRQRALSAGAAPSA